MNPVAITSLRSRLEQAKGWRDGVRVQLERARQEVLRLESEEELADLAAALIRTLIDSEVTEGVKAVEDLLSEGLKVVFDDQDLSVRADVDVQRGKVSVDLITVQRQPDGTVTEGMSKDAFGGAVTTVQSVLLRIIVTLRRGLRPILFMDETLPAFDSNYVHNMGTFLKVLCQRLDMDVLLVSHNPAMVEAADNAYRIQKVDGAATFKKLH